MASSSSIYSYLFVVVTLLILSSAIIATTVQNGLTSQDQQTFQTTLLNDLKSAGNKKSLFYAASALTKLTTGAETDKAIESVQTQCVKSVSQKQAENPEELYNLIGSNTAVKCSPLTEESYGIIQSALGKFVDQSNLSADKVYAVSRILLLSKKRISSVPKVSFLIFGKCINQLFPVVSIIIMIIYVVHQEKTRKRRRELRC